MLTKLEFVFIVGKRIREIRTQQGLSIEGLSLLAGLSYSQIIRIENGQINTSIHQLYLIAQALQVELIDFFNEIQ
jgi:transcriptional regulator with XRE-family HTH domain